MGATTGVLHVFCGTMGVSRQEAVCGACVRATRSVWRALLSCGPFKSDADHLQSCNGRHASCCLHSRLRTASPPWSPPGAGYRLRALNAMQNNQGRTTPMQETPQTVQCQPPYHNPIHDADQGTPTLLQTYFVSRLQPHVIEQMGGLLPPAFWPAPSPRPSPNEAVRGPLKHMLRLSLSCL